MTRPAAKNTRSRSRRSLLAGLAGLAALAVTIVLLFSQFKLRDGRPDFRDLTLHDVHGRAVQLRDFQGRPLVLHFFRSGCPECWAMAPVLAATGEELDDELRIVRVSLDLLPDEEGHCEIGETDSDTATTNDAAEPKDMRYPVLFDRTGDCTVALIGHEAPVHVVFDSETRLLEGSLGRVLQPGCNPSFRPV